MMVPKDKFEATSQVTEAISVFTDEEVKQIILMALIARGLDGILVDPGTIRMASPLMAKNDSPITKIGNT